MHRGMCDGRLQATIFNNGNGFILVGLIDGTFLLDEGLDIVGNGRLLGYFASHCSSLIVDLPIESVELVHLLIDFFDKIVIVCQSQ